MIYTGGCHCQAIRFEFSSDESLLYECNCSICQKKGFLHFIMPKESFQLLKGEKSIHDYQFGTKTAHHYFCSTCGISSFYIPRSHPDGISVNARCIDKIDFTKFKIQNFDGKNWEKNISQLT